MYPDLTTIHRYGTCVYNFLYRLHILVKQYQSALYLNVTGAGYLVPGTWHCSRRYQVPYSSSYLVPVPLLNETDACRMIAGWWWDRNLLLVLQVPETYACIVLRHDVNLHRHYTCKNATYMWRCYDWLNPRCGATNDAEGPCGVIMSVEILRGLRYIIIITLDKNSRIGMTERMWSFHVL